MWTFCCRRRRSSVLFQTHYREKFHEIERLLGKGSIEQIHLDLPTWEGIQLCELARRRVEALYAIVQRSCFLEECSLSLDECNEFPGRSFRDIVANQKYFRMWTHQHAGKTGTIRIAVGYVDSDEKTHVFESSQRGVIYEPIDEKEWSTGIGWDPIWAPFDLGGGDQTIGKHLLQKHWVDVRLNLYLSFRTLINPKANGTFEIHLTVAPDKTKSTSDVFQTFRNVCLKHRVKPLVIFESNSQVQLQTAEYQSFESVAAVSKYAFTMAEKFRLEGQNIVRVRVEAMAFSANTPKYDWEAEKMPSSYYFEFHQQIDNVQDYEKVDKICQQHHATFSHVGAKTFVNARYYSVGLQNAECQWKKLMCAVGGNHSKKPLKEYAVLDDWPDMDESDSSPCIVSQLVRKEFESLVRS